MKKSVLFLILLAAFPSCHNNDDEVVAVSLAGNWKLSEVLEDPGDGSGTFQAVASNKTITFNANGSFSSNGSLCDMSIESNTGSAGTYSVSDATISPSDCEILLLGYEASGNTLVITYPCLEPCKAKYIKVQ